MRWQPWPYLLEIADLLLNNRRLIILKARQLGISWILVAYCLWKALFNENVKVLFLSRNEPAASDLVGGGEKAVPGKAKFIYNHLPDFLRLSIGRDTQSRLDFMATGSILEALPSTEDAGRSTDATIVVCDEWEYHPYAEQNYGAVSFTLGRSGQFIGLSTANKLKSNTFFKAQYKRAMSGQSDFTRKFLAYDLRPGRTEEWRNSLFNEMPAHIVEGEFPRTENEALETLKTMAFFVPDMLVSMHGDTREPLLHELSDKYRPYVNIYKYPIVGKKYCIYTDPSHGKEDPHASVVVDESGEEQASSHGKCPADYCAEIHDALVRLYNNALNAFEPNAQAGGIFLQKINDLGTPHVSGSLGTDMKLKPDKKGWWMSKPLKRLLLDGLEESVRKRDITIHTKGALDEFGLFIRPEGEDPQAPEGVHDDWVMAWAGANQLRRYIPQHETEFKTWLREDRTY